MNDIRRIMVLVPGHQAQPAGNASRDFPGEEVRRGACGPPRSHVIFRGRRLEPAVPVRRAGIQGIARRSEEGAAGRGRLKPGKGKQTMTEAGQEAAPDREKVSLLNKSSDEINDMIVASRRSWRR